MKREEALDLLHQYINSENMLKHSYAAEAVLRAMAVKLNEDADKWALAGLLHDLDVEKVNADPLIHGLETASILEEKGVDPEIIEAIRLHNEKATGIPRSKVFHHALAAGETITGLITATALVYPDKKLASVKAKSIKKRIHEKAFAASVSREKILECALAGIGIDEFVEISLAAMQEIGNDLGL